MISLIISMIEDPDDRAFIESMYNEYHRLMYSQIIQIVKNPWDTQDILQTVLVRLIGKIPKLRELDRNHKVNYIIAACHNTSKNFIRDSKKRAAFAYEEDTDWERDSYVSADEWLERIESREDLRRAWQTLDARSRQILEMKYFLENTDAEIAAEIGVAPASVRMLLTRARNALKKCFAEQPDTD